MRVWHWDQKGTPEKYEETYKRLASQKSRNGSSENRGVSYYVRYSRMNEEVKQGLMF